MVNRKSLLQIEEAPQAEKGSNGSVFTVLIVLALAYPTLLTLTYFLWLDRSSPVIQQTVYTVGKLIQFGFPILVVAIQSSWFADGWPLRSTPTSSVSDANLKRSSSGLLADTPRNNLWIGVMFGLLVVASLLTVYHFILPDSVVAGLNQQVQQKVQGMGLGSLGKFAALSLFYVVIHSFLEEYYWRWFVFDQLQQTWRQGIANLIAAVGFMAHHVVLLGTFLGWDSVFTYGLSLSVAVGGIVWAWMFNRKLGFRSAWLSHAIVDAGIFGLALSILFKVAPMLPGTST